MSGIGKKGLSVFMALLMSFSTAGILSYTTVESGSLVVSAASTYSEKLNVGEELLVDIEKTQTVKSSNESVVQLVVTSMSSVKRVRMKAVGVGTAKVTVYDSAGKAVEINNITVKGNIINKSIELFTDDADKRSIDVGANIKSVLNADGSTIKNSENFGVQILYHRILVWGKPGTYNLKVTTPDSVINYKVTLVTREYEYVINRSRNIDCSKYIKSIKSSNTNVVKAQKINVLTIGTKSYNINCVGYGESTIFIVYTDGSSDTYKIRVRDFINQEIDNGTTILTGCSKVVDYTPYINQGVEIQEVIIRPINAEYYVTTEIDRDINTITYKLAKCIDKPNLNLEAHIRLTNGDVLTDTIRLTEYVYSCGVYTYKDAEFDLAKLNVGINLGKAKIKSYTCADTTKTNYLSIDKTDTKLKFKKKANNTNDAEVPIKIVLDNGITWYIRVCVNADMQRTGNIVVNTSNTIDLNRDIESFSVVDNKADTKRSDTRKITVSANCSKLTIKGLNKGTAKIYVKLSGASKGTVITVNVKPSNKTYRKTIGYNKDGTKIAVVELKGSGATVAGVKVDDGSKMGVTRYDYSILLKPKKAGKSTVTVTCTNGDVIKYVCTVNSMNKTIYKYVKLNTKSAQTFDVNKDMSLKAKGLKISKVENKSTALLKNVSKTDYNFKYTMIKKGTATVKVTLSNGDIITYNITIK